MDDVINVVGWHLKDLLIASILTLLVLFSLGFALSKALSDSLWTTYWHISSMCTVFGSVALAVFGSRVSSIGFLVNASWAIIFIGIAMAVIGAIMDMGHRYFLHRDASHPHVE